MMTARWWLQEAAHFAQGFLYALLLHLLTSWPSWWLGPVVGAGVELYQYLGPDHRDPRLADRCADLLFWTAGGLLTLLF